jgi:hypothetical protein
VQCIYQDNGCDKKMVRKELFEHIKNCECMNKKCDSIVLNNAGIGVKCDQVYCIDDVLQHVHCNYSNYGCNFIGSHKTLIDHSENCVFKMMAPIFTSLKDKISENGGSWKEQQTKINDLTNTIDKKDVEISNLNILIVRHQSLIDDQYKNLNELNALITKQQTELIALTTAVNDLTALVNKPQTEAPIVV